MGKHIIRIHGGEMERLRQSWNETVRAPYRACFMWEMRDRMLERVQMNFMGGGVDVPFMMARGPEREGDHLHDICIPIQKDQRLEYIEACGGRCIHHRHFPESCFTCHDKGLHDVGYVQGASMVGSFYELWLCKRCNGMAIHVRDFPTPVPDPEEYEYE